MSAAGKFVSHTNGTRTVDGASGTNNKMERGGSVVANPIWEPARRTRRSSGSTIRSTPSILAPLVRFPCARLHSTSMARRVVLNPASHSRT